MSNFGHTHKVRSKKNTNVKRLLETRDEDNEAYGVITKALGNCCFEWENKNTGKIGFTKTANRLTKGPNKRFIKVDDLVLIEVIKISVTNEQYMIKMVYTPEEAHQLAKMGELENYNINKEQANAAVVFEKDNLQDNMIGDTDINIDDI